MGVGDHYSSFLSVAAALSLAGWVSQGPNVYPTAQNNIDNYGYNDAYASRHHPYSQPQRQQQNWNFQQQNINPHHMVGQQYANYANNPVNTQTLYQSKDAEENFRSYLELQELVSWQESYRRGDFNIGRSQDYILPALNKNNNPYEEKYSTANRSPSQDDGYLSGDASVQSPSSSVFSGISNNLDEISINSPISVSPQSPESLFDASDLQGAVGGAIGGEEFDIDKILFGDNLDLDENKENFFADRPVKTPFENLKNKDIDLDFVNSHLKNPSFDEFLASPNPGRNPTPNNANLDASFDDPFQMQFTNSSFIDNKFLSNGLVDLEDIDPAILEEALSIDEEFDIDKALVTSLAGKTEKLPTNFKVSPFKSTVTVKEEYPFAQSPRHIVEHDYQKEIKQEFRNYIASKDLSRTILSKNNVPATSNSFMNIGQRTYAPTSPPQKISGKTKKQANKSSYIWSDFPYSYDELIEMPVETFNEIIKVLNDVRQHEAKDIRRKGKNKLAARNCRKRKMEIIDHLDTGVESLANQRANLYAERQRILDETRQLKKSTGWLNDYIFEHMRDSNGSPYSPNDYSLQYTSDGNVYLVPSATGQQQQRVPATKVQY